MIYVFDIFIAIFNIPMGSVRIRILCMKFSTIMVQEPFPVIKLIVLFNKFPIHIKKFSPDTSVLLLLSKVTQKHFRQPNVHQKYPCALPGAFKSASTVSATLYDNFPCLIFTGACHAPVLYSPNKHHHR